MGKLKIGEWRWRFLAAVIAFAVAWTMWIFYQLNPPPLITTAAFEAAAMAKANANAKQNARGVIAPAAAAVPAAEPAAAAAPKEPPVNADKLKFSAGLSLPEQK